MQKDIITERLEGELGLDDLTQEYFTRLRKDEKQLTFEATYINPAPVTYNEGYIRYLNGEKFIRQYPDKEQDKVYIMEDWDS